MNIKVILLQVGGKGVACGGSIPPDHQNLWDGSGWQNHLSQNGYGRMANNY